ncbi:MAG: tetratricopeptide repeat protein [Dehalococcoidia bacterium]|nr:tetratricopeptide repeat protein [Dehalococcoidia bacterium]
MEEELAKKAEVLRKLAESEAASGDFSAAVEHGQEALKLYQEVGDLPNVAMAHVRLARILAGAPLGSGNEVEALKHMEAALAIAEQGPDTSEKAFAYQFIAHQHLHTEEPTTCLVWAQKAVDLFRKLGVFMGTSLGTAQARTGEVDKGIEY